MEESCVLHVAGNAGEILVVDADLAHAASVNPRGMRRRSILIGDFAEACHATPLRNAPLRNVRMGTSDGPWP